MNKKHHGLYIEHTGSQYLKKRETSLAGEACGPVWLLYTDARSCQKTTQHGRISGADEIIRVCTMGSERERGDLCMKKRLEEIHGDIFYII
jgi:hypothetical protein